MQVIATLAKNPQLANFYEIDWAVLPNLTMDLIVPLLVRVMTFAEADESASRACQVCASRAAFPAGCACR